MHPFSPSRPYEPPALIWRNAHLQLVVAEWLARRAGPPPPAREHLIPHADGTTSRLFVFEPEGVPRGVVGLVHGLGGAADSPNTLRFVREGLGRGWRVITVDLRGAGGSRPMPRLYTAADVDEVDALTRRPEFAEFGGPKVVMALSLGGGVLLRWLGLRGRAAPIDCAVAIAPVAHLPSCARALSRWRHRIYDCQFAWKLGRQVRAIAPSFGRRRHSYLRHWTVRRLDDDFASAVAGHPGALMYYEGSSAHLHAANIARPVVIFATADDPFVPLGPLVAHFGNLPLVEIRQSRFGSHLAFIGRRDGKLVSLLPGLAFDALEGVAPPVIVRP